MEIIGVGIDKNLKILRKYYNNENLIQTIGPFLFAYRNNIMFYGRGKRGWQCDH